MTWERVVPGAYRCEHGFAIGIIERSERGFWWWMVIDRDTGKEHGGGRRFKLRQAKDAAEKLINKYSLKVLSETF
jgi:hypothetical protein